MSTKIFRKSIYIQCLQTRSYEQIKKSEEIKQRNLRQQLQLDSHKKAKSIRTVENFLNLFNSKTESCK